MTSLQLLHLGAVVDDHHGHRSSVRDMHSLELSDRETLEGVEFSYVRDEVSILNPLVRFQLLIWRIVVGNGGNKIVPISTGAAGANVNEPKLKRKLILKQRLNFWRARTQTSVTMYTPEIL